MKVIIRILTTPWSAVLLAVICAIFMYIITSFIIEIEDFQIGLIVTISITLSIAIPFAFILFAYIRQIEEQNEELKRLEFATKKMFTIIAHDVRSPLSTLIGLLNAMESKSLTMEEGREYVSSVTNRTENILEFLDGLLFWSREQIDTKSIKKQRFSTQEVINSIKWFLLEEASKKGVSISIETTDFQLFNDSGSYSFIVRNVIQNAIKFTPSGGEIDVLFEEKGLFLKTIVNDNGVGISKSNLDKIFAGDNWVSTKGTENESGSGFGLKTCIYYANLNGGSIEIESEEGKGTNVVINTLMK